MLRKDMLKEIMKAVDHSAYLSGKPSCAVAILNEKIVKDLKKVKRKIK